MDIVTQFYHAKTITRRRKNKILALRGKNEGWIYDQHIVKEVAHHFFSNLFVEDDVISSLIFLRRKMVTC